MLPPNHQIVSGAVPERPWVQWFALVGRALLAERESGTTAQRPTRGLWVGRRYFDVTLGQPIFYDGAVWVDAAGTPV